MANPVELIVFLLFFLSTAFRVVHLQAVGTDCGGKDFLCLDDLRYQTCSQSSNSQTTQTTDLQVIECASSQYCSNADQTACSSSTPSPTTTTVQTTTSTQSTTTTTDTTSTSSSTVTTTTEAPFQCNKTGRFPHSTDCHKYYRCIVFPFITYEREGSCLFGSVFDPTYQRCTNDLNKCQLQTPPFNCQSAGRFPDPSDSTRYYWCSWSAFSSSYELRRMHCPFGYTFNVNRGRCSGFFG